MGGAVGVGHHARSVCRRCVVTPFRCCSTGPTTAFGLRKDRSIRTGPALKSAVNGRWTRNACLERRSQASRSDAARQTLPRSDSCGALAFMDHGRMACDEPDLAEPARRRLYPAAPAKVPGAGGSGPTCHAGAAVYGAFWSKSQTHSSSDLHGNNESGCGRPLSADNTRSSAAVRAAERKRTGSNQLA